MRVHQILISVLLLSFVVYSQQKSFLVSFQKSPSSHALPFSNQEVCALIKLYEESGVVFLGYHETTLLFQSPYHHNIESNATLFISSLLFEYDITQYSYFVVEIDQNELDNTHWRDSVDNICMLFETKLVELDNGNKLLIRVAKSHESKLLSTLPESTYVGHVVPKKHVCQSQGYIPLFNQLAKIHAAPDPYIQSLVDKVNIPDLRLFAEYLSGEASTSPITTRNSLSTDATLAAKWMLTEFSNFGFTVSSQNFRSGYSDNVEAILRGTDKSTEIIIVTAHYDSRAASSTSPTQRAPGANDDGSGTTTLLQIAKIIFGSKIQFRRTIHIVGFSGEEQGLYGSQAYAKKMVDGGANVVALLNADMIAYRAPGAAALCGFPQRYTTPDLTALAITASNTYVPTLSTGRNDRCCSDHRSFFELGFSTTDFSDTHGPIVDPMYHNEGDVVNRVGFDFEQLSLNAKAIFATLLVLAEPTGSIY